MSIKIVKIEKMAGKYIRIEKIVTILWKFGKMCEKSRQNQENDWKIKISIKFRAKLLNLRKCRKS